jgi:glycosyltransferase involved in cell wall biosynthesis
MRLHVLGIPHTQTTKEFCGCAFTSKVHKFLKMMSGREHEIYHYGHTNVDWSYPDVEHVEVVTDLDHRQAYGIDYVNNKSWKSTGFNQFDITDHAYKTFTERVVKEINARKQPNDIVCITFGFGHKATADQLEDLICIETGIGYPASFARWRVYESHAIMNAMYGAESISQLKQDWYWRVIPNYFDPEEFVFSAKKEDYAVYLGRIYSGKGVDIAIESTRRAGIKLKIAGQGSLADMGYTTTPEHVELVGYADTETRAELLSKARCLIIGSKYNEPFAGVQIEAFLSGTPVVTPDWAVFPETNINGLTGFRCHTLREFADAIEDCTALEPHAIRQWAEQYTLQQVAPQYEQYFQDVLDVYTGLGWME